MLNSVILCICPQSWAAGAFELWEWKVLSIFEHTTLMSPPALSNKFKEQEQTENFRITMKSIFAFW